jgi:hypothetical protein
LIPQVEPDAISDAATKVDALNDVDTFVEVHVSPRSPGTDVMSSASGTYASMAPQFTHCEFSKNSS